MNLGTKKLAPFVVLGVALVASTALVLARPTPQPLAADERLPLVEVLPVSPAPTLMQVRAHGTVTPHTESDLVAEVSGRVVWISPSFEPGGSFAAGEVLARVEPRDYETARERARAAVERAGSQLALAKATLARRQALEGSGAMSPAAREEAQASERVAAANLRDAQALLQQSELELERTELRAPYVGQVRERRVDLGEYVNRGAPVAALFATDYAEVRLPIASDDLAFLDFSALAESGAAPESLPLVALRGDWLGREMHWQGRLVRAESTLDPQTRMLHVVARIDASPAAPLPIGLFVAAEIVGRRIEAVSVLPRVALRPTGEVAVVDAKSALRLRRVAVLRADGEQVWLTAGLEPGDRVCVTVLGVVVDGMPVRVAGEADASPGS